MLTTDGVFSFAVMNYAEIGLEEEEFYGWGYVGVNGRRRSSLHPNTGRSAIVHIADEQGNTGRLGQWVFRTDDLNVTTSTTIIGTPTGGQHCICMQYCELYNLTYLGMYQYLVYRTTVLPCMYACKMLPILHMHATLT